MNLDTDSDVIEFGQADTDAAKALGIDLGLNDPKETPEAKPEETKADAKVEAKPEPETDWKAKAEAAEQQAKLLAETLAKHFTGNPQQPAKPEEKPELSTEELDPQTLKLLEEEFPEIGKAIKVQMQTSKALTDKLAQLESFIQKQQAQEAATVQTSVQAEIDKFPALSAWQKGNPEIFEEAVKLDDAFKAMPKYQNAPLSERFAAVEKAMLAIHDSPVKQAKASLQPTKELPLTLGDLPSGQSSTDEQNLAEASFGELVNSFMSMTPAQMDAFLAKNGNQGWDGEAPTGKTRG